MFWPLRLKKPIGKPYGMGPEDTLAAKRVLASLGHMEVPDYGIDEYPDQPMIDAVKSFQRSSGLREDGVMKPGGETEAGLNAAMRAMNGENKGALPERRLPQRNLVASAATLEKTGQGDDGTQVAFAPAIPLIVYEVAAYFGLSAAAAWAWWQSMSEAEKAKTQALLSGDTNDTAASMADKPAKNRSLLVDPPPPNPGLEPPDQKLPDHTESVPSIIEIPSISNLPAERTEPTIFILPAPKPDEFGNGIVERKGNEATRQELMRIRDYFRSLGWKHVAGGRYAPDDPDLYGKKKPKVTANSERKEWHIKGHFGGLKGGHFTDLTFRDTRGQLVHIQTVDVDKNGKPTRRELDTADRIWRAIGKKDAIGDYENEDLILIPKGAQLERTNRFRN